VRVEERLRSPVVRSEMLCSKYFSNEYEKKEWTLMSIILRLEYAHYAR
jgi:hypothetical protein